MLDVATKVVQIAFWFTAGTVAVLTFLSARKTLLQPIRTEIFKIQLAEVKEIIGRLVGKSEEELRDQFGLWDLIGANSKRLINAYAKKSFGKSLFALDESIYSRDYPIDNEDNVDAPWPDCFTGKILYSESFDSGYEEITASLENPLLPSQLTKLLEDYRDAALANVVIISTVTYNASAEIETRFPDIDSLKTQAHPWILDLASKRMEKLKPKADAIVQYIRHEFDVDNLLSASKKKRRLFGRQPALNSTRLSEKDR